MTNVMASLVFACALVAGHAAAQDTVSCCKKADAAATCCQTASGDTAAADSAATDHAVHGVATDSTSSTPSCCTRGRAPAAQGNSMRGGAGRGTVMPDAMGLLHNHAALERRVEEIPNGVKTVTTTSDPNVLAVLRRHAREMYAFYEAGGSVRPHDPMFAELARVADKVDMEFKDVENGIETMATSDDPEVVKLIRAHAAKVTEFVKRGHAALHEGAPLPEDYKPTH